MGSGGETARETVDYLNARGEKARRAQGSPVPAVLARATSSRRCRRQRRAIAVLDRTKEPGARGRAALSGRRDRVRRSDSAGRRRRFRASSAGAMAWRRRNSRRRWSRRSSTSSPQTARRTTSPSASTTTCRTRASNRPGFVTEGDGRRRRLLRSRRRRHGRRQQELDQDHRRGDGRLRAGLLRLRLEEVRVARRSRTCASAHGRSGRAYLVSERNSSPAISSSFSIASTCCGARRRRGVPDQQSLRPDAVWDQLPRRCRSS